VGSKADLTIEDNEIIDVHDCGIWYQDSQDGDDCLITGNTIVDNEIVTGSKGMYFNEGCPTVRWNTIDGKKNGFWVESGMTAKPDLGNTATSDGNNSVDSADAKYCVYVRFGSIVRAENNWWGTPTPHPKKFTMLADWNPYLTSPPSRGLALDGYEGEILPSRAEVLNSPNPFNPSTVINYTVPSRGYVTLAIYDVAGRCVSVLFEGEQGPGWHQNTWDGRASGGERVASGVYFCRLSTGTETVTTKLALLK